MENDEKHLCEYGCGKEAIHQFKNGKWCCQNDYRKCSNFILQRLEKLKGKRRKKYRYITQPIFYENSINFCSYGCGLIGKFYFTYVKKWCCSKRSESCPENKNKNKLSHIGVKNSKATKIETTELCSYGCGQKAEYKYKNGKFCCQNSVKKCPKFIRQCADKKIGKSIHTKESKNKLRKIMLENGNKIRKLIKKCSKEEIKLRKIIMDLHPESVHTFKVLKNKNYEVDIAIPEYKIAVEFDGYYHFDTEDHKKYHNQRQKEIESEGWKFLRYNIYQPFPSKEIVQNDLFKIIQLRKDKNGDN
jgi:very-short-patch-repair endonuclease